MTSTTVQKARKTRELQYWSNTAIEHMQRSHRAQAWLPKYGEQLDQMAALAATKAAHAAKERLQMDQKSI